MSVHFTSMAWRVQGLSMAQKLVLLKISDNANDNGEAWPSISRMADECSCHRSSIIRAVSELEAAGILKVISGGKGRSNRYTLNKRKLVAESNQLQRATSSRKQPSSSRKQH